MKNRIYLKKLNLDDAYPEWEFFQVLKPENGFEHAYGGIPFEIFRDEMIPLRLKREKGLELEKGFVPDTYFFLWKDDAIVGLFKIRHHLTEQLATGSGHIGYAIHPLYRHQGLGTIGLKLAIEAAKNIITEDEIYMSCSINNLPSLKIQLKNGAILHHQDDLHYFTRLKIR